jgi:hypothetical protein
MWNILVSFAGPSQESVALSLRYSFNKKEMRHTKQTKVGREEHNVPYARVNVPMYTSSRSTKLRSGNGRNKGSGMVGYSDLCLRLHPSLSTLDQPR